MAKSIIISGFEPFGSDSINPTEIIVRNLPKEINNFEIHGIVLPVEFKLAPERLIKEIEKIKPSAIIMLGQAGGRDSISIETITKNNMRGKDNSGYAPDNIPIIEDGHSELHSTLPVDKINTVIKEYGLPSKLSNDAGNYVCNCLFYNVMYFVKDVASAGFIHVPFIPEQGHDDKPSLELEDISNAIIEVIKVVIDELDK